MSPFIIAVIAYAVILAILARNGWTPERMFNAIRATVDTLITPKRVRLDRDIKQLERDLGM